MTYTRLRMHAWLRRTELDRRLAEGTNPATVALASYLVCDPASPAYWEPHGATLADLASTALGAIEHQPLR
jgi:hypothetical protein